MDKVTYCAVNGLTIEEYEAIEVAMMIEQVATTDKVLAMMETLLDKGPRDGRPAVVGSARPVPLAYSY